MSIFVTFLGRGRENALTGYREATYEFSKEATETTAFFGLALAKYIQPDTVVILGTKSSQWYVLVENLVKSDELSEEKRESLNELLDAEIKGDVCQKHLSNVADIIKKTIGCQVVPRLIPFGKDEDEQYKIL